MIFNAGHSIYNWARVHAALIRNRFLVAHDLTPYGKVTSREHPTEVNRRVLVNECLGMSTQLQKEVTDSVATSVAADFIGGLMYYLVQHKLPGSKPKENCTKKCKTFIERKRSQDQMPSLIKREKIPQAYCKGRPPWPTVGRRGM